MHNNYILKRRKEKMVAAISTNGWYKNSMTVNWSNSFLVSWYDSRLSARMLCSSSTAAAFVCTRKQQKQRYKKLNIVTNELGGQYEETFNDVKNVRIFGTYISLCSSLNMHIFCSMKYTCWLQISKFLHLFSHTILTIGQVCSSTTVTIAWSCLHSEIGIYRNNHGFCRTATTQQILCSCY